MIRLLPLALLLWGTQPASAQEPMNWDKIRSIAESQHEIVILLIKEQKFDQAVEEAKKIFYLPFPREKHGLLVEEAKEISDGLIHYKQNELALQVLDEGLRSVQPPDLQADLYKEKAYLYKKMGKNEEAMFCFRKAVELKDSVR